MTPHEFIAKWQAADLKERAACQEHFLDLCAVLGQPTPAAADPTGEWYTFEKGVSKDTGGQGFADVWRRQCFGWEYKGKKKDLKAAYVQLCQYRESLGNPPLLVVCDLNRFEIHTNFTGTIKAVHAFDLDGLGDPANLDKLRSCFAAPEKLKPGRTQAQVTKDVADQFVQIADGMRKRGISPDDAAHFLMKLMFCMFAEDIDLLPKDLFLRTVTNARSDPKTLSKLLANLFAAMAEPGGTFGADPIPWVNGGLFADANVVELTPTEIRHLADAAQLDWANIEPSIFGTLFECVLNPDKRSQLGAHYTSRDDIETLIRPVMVAPLRREWDAIRARADKLADKAKGTKKGSAAWRTFEKPVDTFLARLAAVVVLDPACGSGNFLYVAIRQLLDLEKEVLAYACSRDGQQRFPAVRPTQLRGIELNTYARELAQVVIWIGYLQWMRENGYVAPNEPVLDSMDNIENRDAILDRIDPAKPAEPHWPDAEFIVGNPPFLGTKKLRSELGDEYVSALFKLYGERIPNFSDLCCYWFEKARAKIEKGTVKRAGLIATQGIRGGENRVVLKRIKESGDIFFGVGDRDWVLDGANVHISMVGFDDGSEQERLLDGKAVAVINPNLTTLTDVTNSRRLAASRAIGFVGNVKSGAFDIELSQAIQWLSQPNPNGRPSSDVLVPWVNGLDLTRRLRDFWIVNFGSGMTADEAALYEHLFQHVLQRVKPLRDKVKRASYRDYWWIHAEPCEVMQQQIAALPRFLATTVVSKHRLFGWMTSPTLPDHQLIAFARADDYFFGVVHSRIHELWARSQGTQVRDRESGFRYTPTTCFETFPFPTPTEAQKAAIADAAKKLDDLRNNWCNPPEWVRQEVLEFPGSTDGPWKRFVTDADARGIGTVRYPRLVPKDGKSAGELKKRTLTNLYNLKPTWLTNAHAELDAAVFAAYGWPVGMSDDELLAKLLELNLSRAGSTSAGTATDDADGDE